VSTAIQVTSPGTFSYAIYDFNGKLTGKGELTKGMNILQAGMYPGGMYLIRFASNDNQWTDKFVRQ
jgi:hypothetical protein